MLVDIVSKNGNLLLSVPIRGNGTIDQNERNVLAGIKAWMDVNSKSIYGTRVWKTFGEGPLAEAVNPMTAQGFNEGQAYSSQDVRYVERNDSVYATIMRWPAAGDFTFKAFSIVESSYSGEVDKVELLGYGSVPFAQSIEGLTVEVPSTKPNAIAPVFCVTFKEDTRTSYEVFQSMITEMESAVEALTTQAHPFNTGKINTAKDLLKVNQDMCDYGVRNEVFCNPDRTIYTKTQDEAPAFFTTGSDVRNSIISAGCRIEGKVENSTIFRSVSDFQRVD